MELHEGIQKKGKRKKKKKVIWREVNAFDVNMRYWGPEKQEEVNKTEKEALREFFASLFIFLSETLL